MRFPKLAAATQHLQSKPEPDAMKLRHVVESQQFTVPLLMELFDRSRGMERVVARGGSLDYQNRIMATVFYAPSTRTRFSFEAAMHRLGGRVLSTEQARAFSSENARACSVDRTRPPKRCIAASSGFFVGN